jgi:ribonuclease HI
LVVGTNIWSLYFYGSKFQEGVGVDFFFVDPKGRYTLVSSRLILECASSTIEYETLVLGLKKTLNFNIKCVKLFGDLKIIVREVRNSIHYYLCHLKSY